MHEMGECYQLCNGLDWVRAHVKATITTRTNPRLTIRGKVAWMKTPWHHQTYSVLIAIEAHMLYGAGSNAQMSDMTLPLWPFAENAGHDASTLFTVVNSNHS